MTKKWQSVDAEVAKTHPLYGIKGWLLLYVIALIFSLSIWLTTAIFLIAFSNDAININIILLLSLIGITGGIQCYLIFSKNSKFRSIISFYYLIIFLSSLLVAFTSLNIEVIFKEVPVIIWSIISIAYFQKSRRIRVTFENCIRADEIRSSESITQTTTLTAQPEFKPKAHAINTPLPTSQKANDVQNSIETQKFMSNQTRTELSIPSQDMWANALAEYDRVERKLGLYAQSFSEANGNESATKAIYLRLRVSELLQAAVLDKNPKQNLSSEDRHVSNWQEWASHADDQNLANEKQRVDILSGAFLEGKKLTLHEVIFLAESSTHNPSLVTLRDRLHSQTLLHLAARFCSENTIQLLLTNGADTEAVDRFGQKPFQMTSNQELKKLLQSFA